MGEFLLALIFIGIIVLVVDVRKGRIALQQILDLLAKENAREVGKVKETRPDPVVPSPPV
jgi:hypothetical protein